MHMMLNILPHNYNNCTFRLIGCNLIQEVEATTTIHSLHVEKNGGQEVGRAQEFARDYEYLERDDE